MAHLKRAFALGVLTALLLPAADAPKPKVRAITAFITIDAKSYPAQIEETVKCRVCGAYVPAQGATSCGQPGCPYGA